MGSMFSNPYGNRFAGQRQQRFGSLSPRFGGGGPTMQPPDRAAGSGAPQRTGQTPVRQDNPIGNSGQDTGATFAGGAFPSGPIQQQAPTQEYVNQNPTMFAGTSFDPARALTYPGSPYGPGTGNYAMSGGGGGMPAGNGAMDDPGVSGSGPTNPLNTAPGGPAPNRPPAGAVATGSPGVFTLPAGNTWVTPGSVDNASDAEYQAWRERAFGGPEIQYLPSNYANAGQRSATGQNELFSPEGIAWFTQMYGRAPDERYRDPRFWTPAR